MSLLSLNKKRPAQPIREISVLQGIRVSTSKVTGVITRANRIILNRINYGELAEASPLPFPCPFGQYNPAGLLTQLVVSSWYINDIYHYRHAGSLLEGPYQLIPVTESTHLIRRVLHHEALKPYDSTQTCRPLTRDAGQDHRKTEPAQRGSNLRLCGAHLDQKPYPPSRHQSPAYRWASRACPGNPASA